MARDLRRCVGALVVWLVWVVWVVWVSGCEGGVGVWVVWVVWVRVSHNGPLFLSCV